MIADDERRVLAGLSINPAPTPNDVWRGSPYDVPELHEQVVAEILRGVNRARRDDGASPQMVAMQGLAGSGKTHLLGAVREKIQLEGGYFFLVGLINGKTFWESVALAIVEGLGQVAFGWDTQLKKFHRDLTPLLGLPAEVRDAIAGVAPLTRGHLDAYVFALRTFDAQTGLECQDTARALTLLGSTSFEAQDVGKAYLGSEEIDPDVRREWGIGPAIPPAQLVVRDISRLIALTLSPSVIAVDQIDTLFAQANALLGQSEALNPESAAVVTPVAEGLLTLRDTTRRTLAVISCLPDTWELLKTYATRPVLDRIRLELLPDWIPDPEIGRAIVAKRFRANFAAYEFEPPYDTWPITEAAFADAVHYTPRALLLRAERHVRSCLAADTIVELRSFDDVATTATSNRRSVTGAQDQLAPLDARFEELAKIADVSGVLDPKTEDIHAPALLAAGLATWIDERSTDVAYKYDPPPGKNPALHGRLVRVLDAATEDEVHWGFRLVGSPNAIAVISRLKAATVKVGLDIGATQRNLVLLRNAPWPTGKRTAEILTAFRAAGGIEHTITDEDLRILDALRVMRAEAHPDFAAWVASRRPTSRVGFLHDVLSGSDATGSPAEPPGAGRDEDRGRVVGRAVPVPSSLNPEKSGRAAIPLGRHARDGRPFLVDIESLRRHSVIFAGSGSGKTVLIRRLVEECALAGVSAIVLDPNNDLARLGDPWPEPPSGWLPGDDVRAREYLAHTDVVVWTPRISTGRPLAFQPLPDFRSVLDQPDELDQAVRASVAALAPRAGVAGTTGKAVRGKAVLTEALQAYAKAALGGSSLAGFVEFLADLPPEASRMAQADKLAMEAAETLKAAMVTDPLFGGSGVAADPGLLLAPSSGKRARVSVISFAGLASDEERQSFVNQLQMALFAWIKRNPAGDRPLGGLLVMDEAQTLAPATGNTPCTASSIALASQARKYGLGLVFATQAPKGLHNQISGNATTQFFGLLNAPVQQDAARELAAAKGGSMPDIGILRSGQFYAAGEGFSFTRVDTPLCLTHHPKAPLTPEEVIARARRTPGLGATG